MSVYLHCVSHTPLAGFVDPAPSVLAEVGEVMAATKERITAYDPELVILLAPDHYNGFFYDVMPAFCIGMDAFAIGDFGSPRGRLAVPSSLAEDCAAAVMAAGVDLAVSYRMRVDHGFSLPLQQLLGGIDTLPVIPVFINAVAKPLPGFARARLFGKAIGDFAASLDRRVLILASGGLSHEPPVPELHTADALVRDRLKGSGRHLPPEEREARTARVIDAARRFVEDSSSLHPINPEWDRFFMAQLAEGRLAEMDNIDNEELSRLAGKSAHEVKTWVAGFAALAASGPYQANHIHYWEIPEWIAGFGSMSARPLRPG